MPRRFNPRLHPVNSLKHVVDTATAAVPAGVVTSVPVIIAVPSPALASVEQVHEGSEVSSIYMSVETVHNSGTWVTVPRVYMTVFKNPGNNISSPYPASVGSNDAKRFIIHQEMLMQTGVSADANSFPRTMFKGVIRIPRGYKRMGYNDRMAVQFALDVSETTATVNVCVQCIYKEFF